MNFKKRYNGIFICCLLLCNNILYAQGINFLTGLTWEEVKEKAKNEKKIIFVDFYATWCGPCKSMAQSVFTMPEVGEAINDKFLSIKVQTDEADKDNNSVKSWYNDAKILVKDYQVTAVPTFLFFSEKGKLVHRTTGATNYKDFLKNIQVALNPKLQLESQFDNLDYKNASPELINDIIRKAWEFRNVKILSSVCNRYIETLTEKKLFSAKNLKNISLMKYFSSDANNGFSLSALSDRFQILNKEFQKRKNEPVFLKGFARVAEIVGKNDRADEIATSFLKRFRNDIYTKDNLEFLSQFTKKSTDSAFSFFITNSVKINAKTKSHFSESLITSIIAKEEIDINVRALREGEEIDWAQIQYRVARYGEFGNEALVRAKVYRYFNIQDWKNFLPAVIEYSLSKYSVDESPMNLNNFAWILFENCTEEKDLKIALDYSSRAVSLEPVANWMDTYANILFKLGRRKDAIYWASKACSLDGDEVYKKTLESIKQNLSTWKGTSN